MTQSAKVPYNQAMSTQTAGEARRWRLAAIPHLQVGEPRIVDAPAQPGIAAHKNYLATTACDQEMSTTLVTRETDRVRCPDCRAKIDPARQVMTYKATNERGYARTGRVAFTRAELAQQVEAWFDAGWQTLEVTAAGETVAGIAPHPDNGVRMWWSEATDQPADNTKPCMSCSADAGREVRHTPDEYRAIHLGRAGSEATS